MKSYKEHEMEVISFEEDAFNMVVAASGEVDNEEKDTPVEEFG